MNITKVSTCLKDIFNHSTLNQLARQTKFIKRLREVHPLQLVLAMIQTLGGRSNPNLADIHRTYCSLSKQNIKYKPFHNQLCKPGLTQMLKELVEKASELWLINPFKNGLPDGLPFKFIELHDGSSLKLHDSLADTFPGRFTKTAPAAIELHVSMDLVSGSANYQAITPDTESERLYQPYANELQEKLLLADAGYFAIDYCHDINNNGGFFIIRASKNINPEITEAFDGHGIPVKGLSDKKLKQLKFTKDEYRDLTVRWKNKSGTLRIIAFWDRKKSCVSYLCTNLCRRQFSVQDVFEYYGLRWQIELFFKELKSFNGMKRIGTAKKHIVETLVWASMLTLLFKRLVAFAAGLHHHVLISTQKVARCAQQWLGQVIAALQRPNTLKEILKDKMAYLAENACRAHPKRDKKTLLFKLGLSIYPALD